MAIVANAQNTADSGSGTSSSIVLTAPSIMNVGDCILVTINLVGASSITVTPPSGFALRYNPANGTLYSTLIYTKIATASEPSTYTFSLSAASSFASTISSWSGVAAIFPVNGGFSANTTSSGTTTATVTSPAGTYPATALRIVSGYGGSSALSITNGGTGNTILVNSANSGGTFINSGIVIDSVAPIKYSSVTWGSCTLNTTVADTTEVIVFLRPDPTQYVTPHTDFTDVLGVNGSTSTFNTRTSVVGSPMVVAVAIGDPTTTVSSMTSSSGMTFSRIAQAQDASNLTRMELWYTTTNVTNPAITVTFSATNNAQLQWWTFSGALGTLGAITSGQANASAISLSLTTTKNNSQLFFPMCLNFNTSASISNTLESYFTIPLDTSKTMLVGRETLQTPTAGTLVTQTTTLPSTTDWSGVGFEVLPFTITPRTQTGVARIGLITSKTQTGVSRITRITQKAQIGVARLTAKTTKTQTGKARIRVTTTHTTTGKANIFLQRTKTQTGVSKILVPGNDTYTKPHLAGNDTTIDFPTLDEPMPQMAGVVPNL